MKKTNKRVFTKEETESLRAEGLYVMVEDYKSRSVSVVFDYELINMLGAKFTMVDEGQAKSVMEKAEAAIRNDHDVLGAVMLLDTTYTRC